MPDDIADDLQSLSFGSSGRSAATTDTTTTACSSTSGSGPISAAAAASGATPVPSKCDASCPSCSCCPTRRSDPDHKPLRMTDLRFLRRLGSGDIGTVHLAQLVTHNCPACSHKTEPMQQQTTPRLLAAKVMDKEELHGRNKQGRAKAELEILKMLDHPFLPKLIASAEDDRWACLLTDFCPGGDLHVLRQWQPNKRFPEAAVRFYAAEVVVALEYLHMLGVVYRDLKPENVLVRADGHIMLTDFDLSLRCGDSASNPRLLGLSDKAGGDMTAGSGMPNAQGLLTGSSQGSTVGGGGGISASCILPSCIVPAVSCFSNPAGSRGSFRVSRKKKTKSKKGCDALEFVAEPVEARSMSFVGTHEYLAPEIVSGEGHGSAVDWWTLGVLLFELMYGYTPFRGHDNDMTLANIVARALEFPKETTSSSNSSGGKADRKGGRSASSEYCGPPTVSQQAKDLIAGLLVKDPCTRLGSTTGAAAVKRHPFFHGVRWALLRCAKPPLLPPPLPSSLFVQEAGGNGESFSALSAGIGIKDNDSSFYTDGDEEHDDNRRRSDSSSVIDGCSDHTTDSNQGDVEAVLVQPAPFGDNSPPGSPVEYY